MAWIDVMAITKCSISCPLALQRPAWSHCRWIAGLHLGKRWASRLVAALPA
jgi:hypothetical protein